MLNKVKKGKKAVAVSNIETALASGQLELFDAKFIDPPPPIKGDQHSGQHPLFTLQTIRPDMEPRVINVPGGNPIRITPSFLGIANIDDKKVLTYIISQMAAGKNAGHSLSKGDKSPIDWVAINTTDLYQITTGGEGSATASFRDTLKNRLQRLKGTQYEVDLKIGDEAFIGNFSFIGDFVMPKKIKGHHGKLYVQIRPWVVQMVQSWGVLTYHPDYYKIESPLKRRIYEIARFHVREKEGQGMYLQTLKDKSGSTTSLRMFRYQVRELLKSPDEGMCDLLDYVMCFDAEKDMVVFARSSDFLNNRALEQEAALF
ncbi:replication initiator protein A [Trichloromonas sp.]|uniref:replication initiator protein A n=1 Tax=Trichloromonas sp. TaxID=3069249 RepID=UPI002A38AF36|nr:replication initiator protein A [Trichloromonas sp.]